MLWGSANKLKSNIPLFIFRKSISIIHRKILTTSVKNRTIQMALVSHSRPAGLPLKHLHYYCEDTQSLEESGTGTFSVAYSLVRDSNVATHLRLCGQ